MAGSHVGSVRSYSCHRSSPQLHSTYVTVACFRSVLAEKFSFFIYYANIFFTARRYAILLRCGLAIMLFDFFLNLVWFPIGVSRTYGFRTARDAFLITCVPLPHFLFT